MKLEFPLKRSVIFEKCDYKNYILNSDKYLTNIGIGIYIHTEISKRGGRIYSSPSNKLNLEKIFKQYSEQEMIKFYKTFTCNPELKKLKHNPYDVFNIDNKAFIDNENSHHEKYIGNLLKNRDGNSQSFLIYCNSAKITKTAGYAMSKKY